MANELDEMTGPVNAAGRDVNVIEKQLQVKIGFGSVLFEISLWLLGIILMLGMLLNRFVYDGLLLLAEHTRYPHKLINLSLPLGFTAALISVRRWWI